MVANQLTDNSVGFKPYYNWNTFNTAIIDKDGAVIVEF